MEGNCNPEAKKPIQTKPDNDNKHKRIHLSEEKGKGELRESVE